MVYYAVGSPQPALASCESSKQHELRTSSMNLSYLLYCPSTLLHSLSITSTQRNPLKFRINYQPLRDTTTSLQFVIPIPSQAAMSDNDKDSECAACQKTESQLGKPLKSCAKCKVTKYCGRECQTGHWKKHKKDCATNAAATATNASTAPSDRGSSTSASCKNLKGSNEGPFHKLHDKTWLHGRPEEDVFKLFLDAYRLRLNDDYNM